jgi:hypothetical protein
MSEWWTYRLGDFLMFSQRTYDRLFERYNQDVWPLHLVAIAMGVLILWMARSGQRVAGRATSILLAIAWLWIAYAFFWQRFSTIHTYAKWFALAFALEAILLLALPSAIRHPPSIFFILILLYALVPPRHETFALAPDPTALATIVLTRWPLRIIPIAWCAFSAATLLAMATR